MQCQNDPTLFILFEIFLISGSFYFYFLLNERFYKKQQFLIPWLLTCYSSPALETDQVMRLSSPTVPLLVILFAPSSLSFNHAHEQQARNIHPLFAPLNHPSRVPATGGLSPESVINEEEVSMSEENGCPIGEIRIGGECQHIILGALNASDITERSGEESLIKRGTSASIVKQSQILTNAALEVAMEVFAELLAVKSKFFPSTSVLLPVGTPIQHAGASIQFTLTQSVISTAPSVTPPPSPALQALLSSRMPGGISIDIPSISPTFATLTTSSTTLPPPPMSSIPSIVYVPSVFPIAITTSIPLIIFPTVSIPTPSAILAKAALNLPPPPSSSCAKQYTNTDSGAVYGPGLGDFPMNPRPSTFVKRSGSKLTLDGQGFRIVGPNIYWLGLAENDGEGPSYPSQGRVREAMAIVVAMGGNTIRAHTLGISTGNSMSVWPTNGGTNEAAVSYQIFNAI